MCWVMPPGLVAHDVRLADSVEQPGLTVVDVAHDGDHRRPRDQVLVRALVLTKGEVEGLEQLTVLVLRADDLDLVVQLGTEQLQRLFVDRLRRGDHLAEVEHHRDERRRVRIDLLGEVRQRGAAREPQHLPVATGNLHTAQRRRVQVVEFLTSLLLALTPTGRAAALPAECTGSTGTTATTAGAAGTTARAAASVWATAAGRSSAATGRGTAVWATAATTRAPCAGCAGAACGTARAAGTSARASGTARPSTGAATSGRLARARTRRHHAWVGPWPTRTRTAAGTHAGPGRHGPGDAADDGTRSGRVRRGTAADTERVVGDSRTGPRAGRGRPRVGEVGRCTQLDGRCQRRHRCYRDHRGLEDRGRLDDGRSQRRRGSLLCRCLLRRGGRGRTRLRIGLTQPARDGGFHGRRGALDELAELAELAEEILAGYTELFG